jgi:hypothetical protein
MYDEIRPFLESGMESKGFCSLDSPSFIWIIPAIIAIAAAVRVNAFAIPGIWITEKIANPDRSLTMKKAQIYAIPTKNTIFLVPVAIRDTSKRARTNNPHGFRPSLMAATRKTMGLIDEVRSDGARSAGDPPDEKFFP